MDMSHLRPAHEFAINFGVKAAIYGPAGSGKTPICGNTAPRPLLLVSEPGMLTMKKSTTPTYPAFTPLKLEEFFQWFFNSAETKNFDTLIWDSTSQSAEQLVDHELGGTSKGGNQKHGQQAYGAMSRKMMEYLNKLYFMQQKHIVLITKHVIVDQMGSQYCRPYFPGRELNVRVPHLFDLVMRLGDYNIPGVVPSPTKAFRCRESFEMMARDRSGNLNEYEPPNLEHIFKKCLAG